MTTQTDGEAARLRTLKDIIFRLKSERDHLQSALKESIRLQGKYAAEVKRLKAERDAALSKLEAGTHVLVPKEPTRRMMEASLGWREFDCPEEYLPVDDSVGWLSVAYGHYRCMIAAAQEGE